MSRLRRNPALVGLLGLLVLLAAGVAAVLWYVGLEQQRDLRDWQIRLGLIADTRTDAVEHWVSGQFEPLQELANNASLQLYLTQLVVQPPAQRKNVEPAQRSYLRNLIIASAERHGYAEGTKPSAAVGANVAMRDDAGLALLNAQGRIVVATPGMPTVDAGYRKALGEVVRTRSRHIRDIHLNAAGHPVMGFMVPVYAVQGAKSDSRPRVIGVLLGIKNVRHSGLFRLLARQGLLSDQDQTFLVRRADDSVVYLSPLADGTQPTRRRLPLDTTDLAGAFALRHPGAFGQRTNYQGTRVLVTSRAVQGTSWVLVQEAGAAQALKEARTHRRFLLTALLLALFLVAATLVAAWRHGTSVRAMELADALGAKTRALENQGRLLHAVTDNIEDFIFITDPAQRFILANESLAAAAGLSVDDFAGKTMASVLGPAAAERLGEFMNQALSDGHPAMVTRTLDIGTQSGVYHCAFLPLVDVGDAGRGVLCVLHDITTIQRAQRKHADLLRQLVGVLMRVVDMHDPYSANHSSHTAEVALAIGRTMALGHGELETLDLAANLANLGKIFVPRAVLTKTEALTDEEQALLRCHVSRSLDILSDLEFDGPVLETIAQMQEHCDGSGHPRGLKGEEILLTARILAVANAFVALVSPRAYRDAVSIERALDQLLAESHDHYDRRVVAALFHVAENRADWSQWHSSATDASGE
ncbi:MAG TPA: HD domain-containing phosphohydrolase [Gammaproteobacteria bacterium]|nr:HD domain-containing phosphohydrolase [Gammaproteobacteria bacterium]